MAREGRSHVRKRKKGCLVGCLTNLLLVLGVAALLFVAGAFGFFGLHRAFVMLALGLAALSLWRHRDNLKRLAGGTENKVGQK